MNRKYFCNLIKNKDNILIQRIVYHLIKFIPFGLDSILIPFHCASCGTFDKMELDSYVMSLADKEQMVCSKCLPAAITKSLASILMHKEVKPI